jgi:hypothetical protein
MALQKVRDIILNIFIALNQHSMTDLLRDITLYAISFFFSLPQYFLLLCEFENIIHIHKTYI